VGSDRTEAVVNHRRADYVLEKGMWKAVCRGCRWSVESFDRQRASALFRAHRKKMESMIADTPSTADGAPKPT
jgi:hypothetical protein